MTGSDDVSAPSGLDALSGDGCTVFAEPTCGDWNCLNPTHQAFQATDG